MTLPNYLLPAKNKINFTSGIINSTTLNDKIVLAFCMNPTISFRVVEDDYFGSAFLPQSSLTRQTLKMLILQKAAAVEEEINISVRNTIQAIVADGGKDVSKNKLMAVGLANGKQVKLLDIVNTHLVEMNEDFFADLFDGIVSKLHTQNCFVASLIVDNEASQNAGIRSSAKASKLVHFRCGAQTLELLVDALSNHYVGLEESINTAKSVATVINNCKVLLKNFREVQAISNPKKPCLSLLVIGNTRKWNRLFTFRGLQKVKCFIELVRMKEELPPIPAIDWQLVEKARNIL